MSCGLIVEQDPSVLQILLQVEHTSIISFQVLSMRDFLLAETKEAAQLVQLELVIELVLCMKSLSLLVWLLAFH